MEPLTFVTLSAGFRKGIWVTVLVIYFCISNYPKTLRLETATIKTRTTTKKHLLSYSFWESEIWERLSWVLLTRGLLGGCNKAIGWGSSHLNTWLLLRCFTHMAVGRMPLFLASRWHSSSAPGPFHRAVWVSSLHGSWPRVIRESREKAAAFFWPSLPSLHHFHFIPLIRSKSLSPPHT